MLIITEKVKSVTFYASLPWFLMGWGKDPYEILERFTHLTFVAFPELGVKYDYYYT